MIVIHSNGEFSGTNLFQFDLEYELNGLESAKQIKIIKDIKKLFNYNCNNFVTFVKGDEVTVITHDQKAYGCVATQDDRLKINKELNINIKDTLNKLKHGNSK